MNNNFIKFPLTLLLIAALAGLSIYYVNDITSPVIAENERIATNDLLSGSYVNYSEDNKIEIELSNGVEYTINDKDDVYLGTAYKLQGKNGFGTIKVLVSFDYNDVLLKVDIIEFNQSKAIPEVDKFLNKFKDESSEDVDVKGGTTYSSQTIKDLVIQAEKLLSEKGGN